jgi:hypothetical protein
LWENDHDMAAKQSLRDHSPTQRIGALALRRQAGPKQMNEVHRFAALLGQQPAAKELAERSEAYNLWADAKRTISLWPTNCFSLPILFHLPLATLSLCLCIWWPMDEKEGREKTLECEVSSRSYPSTQPSAAATRLRTTSPHSRDKDMHSFGRM